MAEYNANLAEQERSTILNSKVVNPNYKDPDTAGNKGMTSSEVTATTSAIGTAGSIAANITTGVLQNQATENAMNQDKNLSAIQSHDTLNQMNIDAKFKTQQLKQKAQQQNQQQREQQMQIQYDDWVAAFNKQLNKKTYLLNAAKTIFGYSQQNETFKDTAIKIWGGK